MFKCKALSFEHFLKSIDLIANKLYPGLQKEDSIKIVLQQLLSLNNLDNKKNVKVESGELQIGVIMELLDN